MWTKAKNRALRMKAGRSTEVAQPGGQGETPEERFLADGRDDRGRHHHGKRLHRAVCLGQRLGR